VVVRRLTPASRRKAKPENQQVDVRMPDTRLPRGHSELTPSSAPPLPAAIAQLPLTINSSLGMLIPFAFCEISEEGKESDRQTLNSRITLPMRLGGGPVACGEEGGVPRGRGTKSAQGASVNSRTGRVGGRRAGVRPGRVKVRGRHARRPRSGIVHPVSHADTSAGPRLRPAGVKPAGRASRPELATASRKKFSGRLRPDRRIRKPARNVVFRRGRAEQDFGCTSGLFLPSGSVRPPGNCRRVGEQGNRSLRSSRILFPHSVPLPS